MEWVNNVADELDWKTHFGPEEIVYAIADILEKNPDLIKQEKEFKGRGYGSIADLNGETKIDTAVAQEVARRVNGGYQRAKYTLVREGDGLTREGQTIAWVEWKPDGMARSMNANIKEGRSLIMDYTRYNGYTWMTTEVTRILDQRDNYVRFQTTNSVYELTEELPLWAPR